MEKNNFPLVSLITPGWNGVSFVGRLLDSILNQTYPNMEYIYIDDGSTDGTKDVVLSYKEKFQKQVFHLNMYIKRMVGCHLL